MLNVFVLFIANQHLLATSICKHLHSDLAKTGNTGGVFGCLESLVTGQPYSQH